MKEQLRESEQNLKQIESQNKELQYENELQADELIDLKDTIEIQNRLLARQQQKLQNLLGNSVDDEFTYEFQVNVKLSIRSALTHKKRIVENIAWLMNLPWLLYIAM